MPAFSGKRPLQGSDHFGRLGRLPNDAKSSPAAVRVAVVGVGFGKAVHVPALRLAGDCEIVAIAASTQGRADAAARELGVARGTGRWRDLVEDEGIDAITLAVPPPIQAEIAGAALAAGKHVFLEKPVAFTLDESGRLAKLARETRRITAVDFEFPELGTWREARRLLAQGSIGSLRHVSVDWHVETYANQRRLVSWKTTAADGGGTLSSFTSHCLHYLEWFHASIERLSARLLRTGRDPRSGDTTNTIVAEMRDGIHATVVVSTDAFLGAGHRLQFFGEEGTLVLENASADHFRGFTVKLGTRQEPVLRTLDVADTSTDPSGGDGRIVPVSRLMKRFLAAVRGEGECRPNVEDGHRAQVLLETARQSNSQGGTLVAIEG